MSSLIGKFFKSNSHYLAIPVSLFLVGCSTIVDRQYHTPYINPSSAMKIVDGFSAVPKDDPEKDGHTYEHTLSDLYYLEYNEEGKKFDGRQLEVINRAIAASNKPVYLVVYVHGWRNNASIAPEDPSLDTTGFPLLLARRNFQNPDMNTIGVYIGWRGEESKSVLKSLLSLERRAKVADTIGNSEEFKSDIVSLVNNVEKTKHSGHSLIIGHSLGGRLLSRAFMQYLKQTETVEDWPLGSRSLLVTLNSAISSNAFNEIYQDMPGSNPKSGIKLQRPLWINLTSKDDIATLKYVGLAPFVGIDILDEPGEVKNNSKNAVIGQYTPYISHEVDVDSSKPPRELSAKCQFIQSSNGQLIPRGVESWFKIPLWDPNHGNPNSDVNEKPTCDKTLHLYRNEDYKRTNMTDSQTNEAYKLYHTSILKPLYDDHDKDANGYSKYKGPSIPLGYMWNFRVDKSLIDHSAEESKINKSKGVHNAFVQTTLGRMLDDMLFTAPESRSLTTDQN